MKAGLKPWRTFNLNLILKDLTLPSTPSHKHLEAEIINLVEVVEDTRILEVAEMHQEVVHTEVEMEDPTTNQGAKFATFLDTQIV